ncbi:MFS transporter [Vibrio brasiliensis]|uniref:MFS transporter n=1 Tax=Vibrio brasiliensis TaxID=170652 RepID=UPI001EFEBB2A|nr:MFS transporter [Vibrio brasiliensis]MCG9784621.1 MFS transporter [Vibrio brasiliensis]
MGSISQGLHATPSQVSLLFSSYFFITVVMMLATDSTANHLELKETMVLGSFAISLFALPCGRATSVYQLIGYRSRWGQGNALFVATELTLLVTLSHYNRARPVKYYEAALGAGIACGPLLGAALGQMSWRYPFIGTAVLMLVAGGTTTKWGLHPPSPRLPGRG